MVEMFLNKKISALQKKKYVILVLLEMSSKISELLLYKTPLGDQNRV